MLGSFADQPLTLRIRQGDHRSGGSARVLRVLRTQELDRRGVLDTALDNARFAVDPHPQQTVPMLVVVVVDDERDVRG